MARLPNTSRQTRALLHALAGQPRAWRHGYALAAATGLKSGTLYPLLMRLQAQGLLEAQWQPTLGVRPPRHLYRLTGAGLALARERTGTLVYGRQRSKAVPVKTLRRRCAQTLVGWAMRLLPRAQSVWGEAMGREVDHIASDGAAFAWALGALRTAVAARTGAFLGTRSVGIALALLALAQALSMVFAPLLTVAWRLHWLSLVRLLGGRLPGDDYRRFIPLLNATPLWQLALWGLAGIMFFTVAWRLLAKRDHAFALCAAAVVLVYASAGAGWLDRQWHPALAVTYACAFHFARPSLRRDVLLPAAAQMLTLGLLAALGWRENLARNQGWSRRASRRPTAALGSAAQYTRGGSAEPRRRARARRARRRAGRPHPHPCVGQ